MSVIKRLIELGVSKVRTVYYFAHDEYRGEYPPSFKGYTIGYLIDAFPFEIEKLKSEGRFYLRPELLRSLKDAMTIAKMPKQKNKNQMEIF